MSFAPNIVPDDKAKNPEPLFRRTNLKELPDISDDEEDAYKIDFTKFNRQQKLTWNHIGGAFADNSFRSNHFNPFAP